GVSAFRRPLRHLPSAIYPISTECLICNILLRRLDGPFPSVTFPLMNTQNQSLSRKILIVDDDPRLRDLVRRYLSEQGFNVVVAVDAKDMGKLWQREHFGLLVLDLVLPGEDGLSICRRLRGCHGQPPVIILPAQAEEIHRRVGLEMGA